MKKKYKVVYVSSTCNYTLHFNTIKEVKRFAGCNDNYYAEVSVWDYELEDFIYFKYPGRSKPDIDLIFTNPKSDLRTKTRMKKEE